MTRVHIQGAGPAGCCAALSAMQRGAAVEIADRTFRQRHKVCGEFFSPGIEPVLERLGVWNSFHDAGPAIIRRVRLFFRSSHSSATLDETGWGLSRFVYDQLLLDAVRGSATLAKTNSEPPNIVAFGRSHENTPARGDRIFGWKAHFEGPQEDAVELYFFNGCYIGLNAVEGGRTNLCGLGPERVLRQYGFDIDAMIDRQPALRERTERLRRLWPWMHVGPLVFQNRLLDASAPLRCGDALSFVDPFTGSGLLAAALTGELAGIYAAEKRNGEDYLRRCQAMLRQSFQAAGTLRRLAGTRLAELVGGIVPPRLLFAWTRPQSEFRT